MNHGENDDAVVAPTTQSPDQSLEGLTIAESVALMLGRQPGLLAGGAILPLAGALIELAVLERISSVERKGFFVTPMNRLLTVSDPSTTGNTILDEALAALVKHGKPCPVDRAISRVRKPVLVALHQSLEARGLVHVTAGSTFSSPTLAIADEVRVEQHRTALRRAQSLPRSVTDPRVGAVIDLLRNGGESTRGYRGPMEEHEVNWYPDHSRETIAAILRAEEHLTLTE